VAERGAAVPLFGADAAGGAADFAGALAELAGAGGDAGSPHSAARLIDDAFIDVCPFGIFTMPATQCEAGETPVAMGSGIALGLPASADGVVYGVDSVRAPS